MRKTIAASVIVLMMGSGMASAGQLGPVKKAGEVTGDAAKAVGGAAEDVGKATVDTTKKATKSAKKAVTGQAHATCADGTRQAGKTEKAAATACASHGGVKK